MAWSFLYAHCVGAVRDDEVRHRLPGLLAARFSGIRGLQPHRFHLGRPLPVMVGPPHRPAFRLLPDVDHLVDQRGQDQLIASAGELIRIQRQLVGRRILYPARKPLRRKVAFGMGVALQRDQDIRQPAGKQLLC